MKLPRTNTRGVRATSAPPPTYVPSSLRLTYATSTLFPPTPPPAAANNNNDRQLRPRRNNNVRGTTPAPQRLGSPFTFHPNGVRAGTPSTVTSVSESLRDHPVGCATYWLRSSRQSEMEYHITRLATPHDLRVLIEVAQRSGDGLFINRVHGILGDSILAFMGVLNVEEIEVLKRMSLGMLIQHADTVGFWSLPGLPGIGAQNGGCGVVDRYATPPGQMSHQFR